jgi:hypothetical protein
MKHSPISLCLVSVLGLLCGCGKPGKPPEIASIPAPASPKALEITGNWQFNTKSTVGMAALTLGGAINQSDKSIGGAVHVNGSDCFDWLTTVTLTGTVTGSDMSLNSDPVAGQVVTFTGTIRNYALTGTYSIVGGCADGDQGSVTGVYLDFADNELSGAFATSGGGGFAIAGDLSEHGPASAQGSIGLAGSVTFSTPCFSSGTIKSGTFPSDASFIVGASVTLEIETDNGTIFYAGMLDHDNDWIIGRYEISGGSCDQVGTAKLVISDPWDY